MPPALVIGYGNPLRGDDGAGWRVAQILEEKWAGPNGPAHLFCHQLTPEVVLELREVRRVLFVDASATGVPGTFDLHRIEPRADPGASISHHVSPETLLQLTLQLFGAAPEAWMLTVAAADFEPVNQLSPVVEAATVAAAEAADILIAGWLGGGGAGVPPVPPQGPARLRATIRGMVQGVGFRPFVFRLATELALTGFVQNTPQGVIVEVEGARAALDSLLLRLGAEKPPHAFIQSLEPVFLEPAGEWASFEIRESDACGATLAIVPPDIATCPDCLAEMADPAMRRFGYAFTNCTNCGPRYTIIEGLPYDRPATAMRGFPLCADCAAEYHDPSDRRFHAQPVACPACGPRLWFEAEGARAGGDPLEAAAGLIRAGRVVAMKGLGGFLLLCDARSEDAVRRLRERKHREEKPFAVLFPGVESARGVCHISPAEERLLLSAESPIVLLVRRAEAACLAAAVAPGNPRVGAMLPSSPLHHLLMGRLGFPVVATSGNLSDEPICTDNDTARGRLSGVADGFLMHDRPVVRAVDDSVVRVAMGREMVMRRARGYAPLPVRASGALPCILAVGAHLKNTVALSIGDNVFTSQHIGDLDTAPAFDAFRRTVDDLVRLLGASPVAVACDLHPDYLSTRHAHTLGLPVIPVQHHHAHIAACMGENELEGEVLGVSWDGTGYGGDGTVWGGEFLLATAGGFRRAASLRPFRLPGGEAAVREPRRSALGLLHAAFGAEAFAMGDILPLRDLGAVALGLLRQAIDRGVNCPVTTSAGRLFDAVAALLGLRQVTAYEGQSAMMLEFAAAGSSDRGVFPFALLPGGDGGPAHGPQVVVDWQPALEAILQGVSAGEAAGDLAARFHRTLAAAIVAVARKFEVPRVVLSGGCFQNRLLLELAVDGLREAGFSPFWHQRIPPNDGGIAPGQVFAAAAVLRKE